MKRIKVSRYTSYTLHAIFYAAILSGLIWQITEISVNFFKYETVSVIKVIMPEDDNVMKYFNLCVDNFRVVDLSALSDYLKEKNIVLRSKDFKTFFVYNLTFRERFKLTKKFIPHPDLFNGYDQVYIFYDLICYQKRERQSKRRANIIYGILKANISDIYTFFSLKFPGSDIRQKREIRLEEGKFIVHHFSSSVYHTIRLKYPYIDNCKHYPHGIFYHYVDCTNQEMLKEKKKIVNDMPCGEEDSQCLNYSYSAHDLKDTSCLRYQECDDYAIFTYVSLIGSEIYGAPMAVGLTERSNVPSQRIVSKPKIENVDYMTYIFGALGSWIGFSFIYLNPINKFFRRIDKVEPQKPECVSKEELSALRLKCNIYELRCDGYESRFNEYGNKISRMEQILNHIITRSGNPQLQN